MGLRFLAVLVALIALAGFFARGARAERLAEVREVASGDYYAPRISPDGDEVLVTGAKFRGLRLVRLEDGASRTLSEGARAGLDARFLDGDRVLFEEERAGARRSVVARESGEVRAATYAESEDSIALASADRIYVRDAAGELSSVASGDRFFSPEPSPDGSWVAFQGLATGIYLYQRSTKELLYLGPGTAPAWSPQGDRLVFERTEDDGHEVVGSDLHLFDLSERELSPLTRTPRIVERRPSFGPAGETVAYDDDRGAIFLGRIAEDQ